MKLLSKIFLPQKLPENTLQESLKVILPFKPKNIHLYEEALTHKSQNIKDKNGYRINFERLEFLGDAAIETIISAYLFEELPHANEGELTVMRSKIVNRKHLNELGENLKIADLLLSYNSSKQFGKDISGNLYEALVGAIFLDRGFEGAREFIYKNMIDPYIDLERLDRKISSYKSYMIEWAQKKHLSYKFVSQNDVNNGNSSYYKVHFYINQKKISQGRSAKKKKAEEIAARRAYYMIKPDINGKA